MNPRRASNVLMIAVVSKSSLIARGYLPAAYASKSRPAKKTARRAYVLRTAWEKSAETTGAGAHAGAAQMTAAFALLLVSARVALRIVPARYVEMMDAAAAVANALVVTVSKRDRSKGSVLEVVSRA